MRSLASILLLLAACGGHAKSAAPSPRPAELERIDVFGSRQLDRDTVLAKWGDQLAALLRANDADGDTRPIKKQLLAEIGRAGKFALIDITIITYAPPSQSFATVDLVDAEDRERRMTFAPAPTGTLPDPDGLLALWREYAKKATGLVMSGVIKPPPAACPFWHCITFNHESLVTYRDAFAARVPPVERELTAILREDSRPEYRADAAFLLAHIASGDRVVELMLPSIHDPSETVRNNAMRVLAMIARNHPEIAIPIDPILDALRGPTTFDRNKASAILAGITKPPGFPAAQREAIRTRAGDVLVEMLALRQPNNHDFAYLILKQISGRDLGEHAVDAWRAWVRGG